MITKIEVEPDVYLHFEAILRGKDHDILVLHGLTASMKNWYYKEWTETLQKYGNVYFLDLRAHGESDVGDPKKINIDRITRDIFIFLHKVRLQNIIGIGHCFGGIIFQNLFAKYKKRAWTLFSRIIFLSTFEQFLLDDVSLFTKLFYPIYYNSQPPYMEILRDEMISKNFSRPNKRLPIPTLTIACSDDPTFIPPRTPNNQTISLDNCGHTIRGFLHGKDKKKVLKVFNDYLSEFT